MDIPPEVPPIAPESPVASAARLPMGALLAPGQGWFRALRHVEFRIFWAGNFVSNIGSWMQNVAQGWLVLTLTNSPFWLGRQSGLKSLRSEIFKRFPRTGIPDEFSTYSEFTDFVSVLVKTKCIDNAKKIWWDVRVHPFFDTVAGRGL